MPEKMNKQIISKTDVKMLHELECQACPLANIKINRNPDMPASGAKHPLVYCLGEAPGAEEDQKGIQFVGGSGQVLHNELNKLPKLFRESIRYNNVVRTRPHKNETPNQHIIECCRPSVVKDIEETKPKAILGFGNIPLQWVTGVTGIRAWRGRRTPVKVGSHICWYYPIIHPASILRESNQHYDFDDEDRKSVV